ncbi:hypothetical protein K7X08_013518 [Anisodus acutangulus]|uniref:3'-5' exonuclease domain-containing protein n=1 Tax=Anisodus acutangulus TaxID=402998 RepID=A0A9Q1LP05_9SOLA|nr:hypothetical protein K7X08_013518 [Anisodus acutangulus]
MELAIDHLVEDDRYDLYDVYFSSDRILTTVTHDPAIVTDWIKTIELLHQLIVGLDVEWRPNIDSYQNPVATLQLCVGHRCLIFQLIYCQYIPHALTEFLLNPRYEFVGVGIENDVEKLEKDYKLFVENVIDLRQLTADVYNCESLRDAGLKRLCKSLLGREVEKPKHVAIGRWDKKRLDMDQVHYACVDAFVSFLIGKHLTASGEGGIMNCWMWIKCIMLVLMLLFLSRLVSA